MFPTQLDFVDFDLEESDGCLYDSLAVLGNVEGTEEIGRTTRSKTVYLKQNFDLFFSMVHEKVGCVPRFVQWCCVVAAYPLPSCPMTASWCSSSPQTAPSHTEASTPHWPSSAIQVCAKKSEASDPVTLCLLLTHKPLETGFYWRVLMSCGGLDDIIRTPKKKSKTDVCLQKLQ